MPNRPNPTKIKAAPEPFPLQHLPGCPSEAEGSEGPRVETFPADRPGGIRVTVTRCGDCGAQRIVE